MLPWLRFWPGCRRSRPRAPMRRVVEEESPGAKLDKLQGPPKIECGTAAPGRRRVGVAFSSAPDRRGGGPTFNYLTKRQRWNRVFFRH